MAWNESGDTDHIGLVAKMLRSDWVIGPNASSQKLSPKDEPGR